MSVLHRESDLEDMTDLNDSGRDREISLGTSTLLGIFFALALVCSAFFGFGYSLGRKSAQSVPGPVAESVSSGTNGLFKSFKPSPSGSAKAPSAAPIVDAPPESDPSPTAIVVPVTKAVAAPVKKAFDPDAAVVGDSTPVVTAKPAPKPAAVAPVAPAVVSGGTAMVQVAAVSHQEDADVLLTALRRKGYSVSVRQEAQDKLLHVQLGPYASKKDAEAMRQRLLGDGYNAIVK